MDRYYAEVKWHAEDIRSLKPEWSKEQAEDFLSRNGNRIADRLTEIGWEVISTLLEMEE